MKNLSYFLILISIVGCGVLWEYRSLHEFSDMTWSKSETVHFDLEITESGVYDVVILFRHVHGFPYADLHTEIAINGNGMESSETVSIPIIGEDKKYLGEGSVDLWDVEYQLFEKKSFEKGTYSVDMKHLMSQEEVKLAMEIGIMVTKSE